jgi:hypothetical protein
LIKEDGRCSRGKGLSERDGGPQVRLSSLTVWVRMESLTYGRAAEEFLPRAGAQAMFAKKIEQQLHGRPPAVTVHFEPAVPDRENRFIAHVAAAPAQPELTCARLVR